MKRHIVFTGGGTGGHVYPALAIIEILRDKGYEISWIGSKSGIEYSIVTDHNINFYSIPSGKLRRYFSLRNFLDLFKIGFGLIKSFFILLKLKPDIVFSKGGYVTVPPIVASKILKIKSFTHESDFDPGLATRLNSKFVDKILLPYEETRDYFGSGYNKKLIVTGNPVRRDFFSPDLQNGTKVLGFNNNKPTILILGGSLGAREINDLVLDCKSDLTSKFNIYHQMGAKNYKEIDEDSYKSVPYIRDNMADILAASSLVVSRSGAGAVWEFITVGTPSLLIPLTSGTRGDQLLNASYFKDRGAAEVLSGNDVTKDNFLEIIDALFTSNRLEELKDKSRVLGNSNCAENICKVIGEVI